MVITGGGEGIMGAAQEGAGREKSFGLNILLPFEQRANDTILNDSKLITYKYFFTRKLHFVKESHAVICFPGGFGTMDEAFETMTLIQTGKARMVPMVLINPPGGNYWTSWADFIRDDLLNNGLISAEDFNLFKVTESLDEAVEEVTRFYHNFHSYRFVGDQLVIRVQRALTHEQLTALEHEFADILTKPKLTACNMLPAESNEPEIAHLPRVCLNFNNRQFGRLRALINRLNEY